MNIEEAIKQESFPNDYLKAVVNIAQLNSLIENNLNEILRNHGLTLQQYNILRILRGQKGKAVGLSLIAERMVNRSSNVSRLIDKLVEKGFAKRRLSSEDRRQKFVSITTEGRMLIDRMIRILDRHIMKLNFVKKDKVRTLNDTLNELRAVVLRIS